MKQCITSLALFSLLLVHPPALNAQAGTGSRANYELAARWRPHKVSKLVFSMGIQPHWLEASGRFWYSWQTSKGRFFYLVDPVRRTKTPIFDSARMAAMLTRMVLTPYDAQHLPISRLKFVKKDTAVQFDLDVQMDSLIRVGDRTMKAGDFERQRAERKAREQRKAGAAQETPRPPEAESKTTRLYFEYELATAKLTLLQDYEPPPTHPGWASVSPDEKVVVFARGHNLWMMDGASFALAQKRADDKNIKEVQLTTDGEEHFSFAARLSDEQKKAYQKDEKDRKDPRVPPIGIIWSRDSKRFACIRSDERKVGDLWVINSLANPRPLLETYRWAMPGEENQPQLELLVFDVEKRAHVKVKADAFKDQSLWVPTAHAKATDRERDFPLPARWIAETSDKLYFFRQSRDFRRLDLCLADVATGDVRVLIEERLNTYVETMPLWIVENGKEILFWSERDGWGHWYLYDELGKLKSQITSGEYSAQQIVRADEKARVLYFNACGRESGEDPYYVHLYRIGFDGSGLKLLNPGDATHSADMDDSMRFFVDTASRVDSAPTVQLRDSSGKGLLDLETTDVSALKEAGFRFPEPFKVKADDGVTDLYGVMYKPYDFDPSRKYPIIAYVYPGPQTESVTKSFSPHSGNASLAQLGFIVIEVGNRGGHPQRSKWYHNYGYGNLRDYGLADKKRAIEQLAIKYPYIDLTRVGIYGHSGGGFMTAAAMLVYPDFFKVGVASSGNHENNVYSRWWSEKHHGVKEVTDKDGKTRFEYNIETNSEIARNLKGHLLLATGDMDDNVHPANTFRLAAALIRANKRFDFFLFPGQRHGYGDMGEYWFWIMADYFCRHLLGDGSQSVDVVELNREREQVGDKRPR